MLILIKLFALEVLHRMAPLKVQQHFLKSLLRSCVRNGTVRSMVLRMVLQRSSEMRWSVDPRRDYCGLLAYRKTVYLKPKLTIANKWNNWSFTVVML